MKFTVVWRPTAISLCGELWLSADDRNAISLAADEIDRILATSPLEVGESRVDNSRVVFVPPLGVYYSVSVADQQVIVWDNWLVK